MPLMNKRIVAIDDTDSILTFLRISLEALGAKFQGAATAAGGMALCESDIPDLVVLDLGLPDKEGFSILQRLKRLNSEKNLPVIVLTVRNEPESINMAKELGAYAYLTKPFIMDDLIDIIHEALHIKQSKHLSLVKTEEATS
jgi:DNA-binding response OmpR family regulator